MKFALIGQEIPALLPSMLADLLFSARQDAQVWIEERNGTMLDLLNSYGEAVVRYARSGASVHACAKREEVLRGADCVIYAGDLMAASRFQQDREALLGDPDRPDDPGLSDQARVNGGIGGLLHTLRQGQAVYDLCDTMAELCPGTLVIVLSQPQARVTEMFLRRGFRAYGIGRSTLHGPGGLEGICKKLHRSPDSVSAVVAGLPGFSFLLEMSDRATGEDLLPEVHRLAEKAAFGRLPQRWLNQYEALSVGRGVDHAELLPAQADFTPEEKPAFGESVERRKERILWMHTVGERGLGDKEAQMAQLLLLSRAPSQRPVRLALALLRGESLEMEDVTRRNGGQIRNLPADEIISAGLTLVQGREEVSGLLLPGPLADICLDVGMTNRLAAAAAAGDRSALRECVELDPAMEGLDMLYVQDVVDRMIALHGDILTRFTEE